MKRRPNKVTALLLAAVLFAGVPAYASSTVEKIERIQQENIALESDIKSTQERIAALEAQKSDSQSFLKELNTQLGELTEALSVLQEQYDQKESEIRQTSQELADAQIDAAEQYEDMKIRIRYLYEQSVGTGLLDSIFSTDDFMEILSRAETFSQVTKYDREMLATYTQAVETVQEKEAQLQLERTEIAQIRENRLEQQEQIQQVYDAAYDELCAIEESIDDSGVEISTLRAQIEQREETLNQLMLLRQQEEEAEKAAAAEAAAAEAAAAVAAEAEAAVAEAAAAETAAATPAVSQTSAEPASTSSASVNVDSYGSAETVSSDSLTYLGNFKLTAYCGCSICCGKYSSDTPTTASGAVCVQGVTVAMAGVSFGTQLSINGHIYTVQDRGTSYGHVDIYFNSHADALAFGLQYADVYLVG